MDEIVTLDYGSGGIKTSELIEEILVPAFENSYLSQLGDGAVLPGGEELVFSTDSFVVTPWKFPGGDIGKLCVCGTVNDICMAGGIPKYLSLSFILEEGFSFDALREITASIAGQAQQSGVVIVTGDTKVVEAGSGDGIYINTAGIGLRRAGITLGRDKITVGDSVIVSGSVGSHGTAVMMAREGLLHPEDSLKSDCASLHKLAEAALLAGGVHILRDPTRGGIATTLNEFVEGTGHTIELDENAIPVQPAVASACGLLGIDPLYCACEGRMLAVVAKEKEQDVINALHAVSGGENAVKIGTVTDRLAGNVVMNTRIGGSRILTKLTGQQLPRIC